MSERLLAAISENWTALEVIWTAMATVGILYSSRALSRVTSLTISSVRDGMEWPTRRRLVKRIRDAAGAYFRHIGFLLIGIASLATPQPPYDPDSPVIPGLTAAIVLCTVVLVDIISLQWDEWDWVAIVRALIRDPELWDRLVEDEQRLQQKTAEQIGETLPGTKQERRTQANE